MALTTHRRAAPGETMDVPCNICGCKFPLALNLLAVNQPRVCPSGPCQAEMARRIEALKRECRGLVAGTVKKGAQPR